VVGDVYGAAYAGDPKFEVVGGRIRQFAAALGDPPRILVAKLGQDGNDRDAKVIASTFAISASTSLPAAAARNALEPADRSRRRASAPEDHAIAPAPGSAGTARGSGPALRGREPSACACAGAPSALPIVIADRSGTTPASAEARFREADMAGGDISQGSGDGEPSWPLLTRAFR